VLRLNEEETRRAFRKDLRFEKEISRGNLSINLKQMKIQSLRAWVH
jgi:hypothetical protein